MLDLLAVPFLALAPVLAQETAAPEDDRSVKELRRDLQKEEEVEERSMILLLLANKAVDEPKDAKTAWEGVAEGLEDESFEVRREAVRLLTLDPEREIAVKSLTKALDSSIADLGSLGGRGGAAGRGGGGRGGRGGRGGGAGGGRGGAGGAGGAPESREAAQARNGYVEDLLNALAKLPDDRSIKSTTRFFEQAQGRTLGRFQLPAGETLGELGTRGALETVRKGLEEMVEQAERAKELQERLEEQGSQDGARGGRGGRGGGGGRGGAGGGPNAEETATGLHQALVSAANKAKAEEIPDYGEDVAKDWKKCLGKNSKVFPSKLGKIKPLEEEGD